MAVNSVKLLPPRNINLAKRVSSISPVSNETSIDGEVISNIGVKVEEINNILKGTVAFEKKKQDIEKKEAQVEKREKEEENLEGKDKDKEKKDNKFKIGLPEPPGKGTITNFISNTIFAWLAFKLVDFVGILKPIIGSVVNIGKWIVDIGGKVLGGLVTFVGWGYKASDAAKGFLGDTFGKDAEDHFDKFTGLLTTAINTAAILLMASSDTMMDKDGGSGNDWKKRYRRNRTQNASKAARQRFAQRYGGNAAKRRFAGMVAGRTSSAVSKGALRTSLRPLGRIPIVGGLIDFAINYFIFKDPIGKAAFRAIGATLAGFIGGAIGSIFPGPGTFIGAALGGMAGDALGVYIYETIFENKTPKKSGTGGDVEARAEGGPVMADGAKKKKKKKKVVKRTLIKSGVSKGRRKKNIRTPKKPQLTKFRPGKNTGGEENIFQKMWSGITDLVNPGKRIEKVGKDLSKTDYFGPILAVTSKVLLGEKPSNNDYKNAGVGINQLINTGLIDGQISGGIAAAMVEGGYVDAKTFSAINSGGDITSWVEDMFKDSVESKIDKQLRGIQKDITLQKNSSSGGGGGRNFPDPATGFQPSSTPVSGSYGPILDLISKHESGDNYDAMAPGTTLPGATKMTIAEVADRATGAVGRWQNMPQHIISRAKAIGLDPNTALYNEENQLKIAEYLIGRGQAGVTPEMIKNNPDEAMLKLARVWAAIPVPYDTQGNVRSVKKGESYYVGVGNNAANHITPQMVYDAFGASTQLQIAGGGSVGGEEAPLPQGGGIVGGEGERKPKTMYLHWTAGDYNSVVGPYHTIFTGDGKAHRRHPYDKRTGHTYYRNTNSVGLSVAAMGNGSNEHNMRQAPTNAQLESMVSEAARLAKGWGWGPSDINIKNIMTHGEAGSNRDGRNMHDNYGPSLWKGTGERWDLDKLRKSQSIGQGGPELRNRIKSKLSAFAEGGFTKSGTHQITVGEEGREFVMDADSTRALEENVPGFLSALNKANHTEALNVLKAYASYEMGGMMRPITIDVEDSPPSPQVLSGDDGSNKEGMPIVVGSGNWNDCLYKR